MVENLLASPASTRSHLLGIALVGEKGRMQVAVADMAERGDAQPVLRGDLLR